MERRKRLGEAQAAGLTALEKQGDGVSVREPRPGVSDTRKGLRKELRGTMRWRGKKEKARKGNAAAVEQADAKLGARGHQGVEDEGRKWMEWHAGGAKAKVHSCSGSHRGSDVGKGQAGTATGTKKTQSAERDNTRCGLRGSRGMRTEPQKFAAVASEPRRAAPTGRLGVKNDARNETHVEAQ
ncbi:hypothetical protein ERJ75_000347400 [Trypanosoma vivax]|nr:hypothetical protein ERJ75_000347400 [Trypanosoma vivax]